MKDMKLEASFKIFLKPFNCLKKNVSNLLNNRKQRVVVNP